MGNAAVSHGDGVVGEESEERVDGGKAEAGLPTEESTSTKWPASRATSAVAESVANQLLRLRKVAEKTRQVVSSRNANNRFMPWRDQVVLGGGVLVGAVGCPIHKNDVHAFLEYLRADVVQVLSLGYNDMDAEAMAQILSHISNDVSKFRHLTEVSVSHNFLGDTGVAALGALAATHPRLRTLVLVNDQVGGSRGMSWPSHTFLNPCVRTAHVVVLLLRSYLAPPHPHHAPTHPSVATLPPSVAARQHNSPTKQPPLHTCVPDDSQGH
jgi:hypothetical protein